MADLARLVVRLEAENGRLLKGLQASEARVSRWKNRAQASNKRVERSFTNLGSKVTQFSLLLGSALSAVGLISFAAKAREIITFGNEIAKAADKIGIATQDLQEFQFAASQTTTLDTRRINLALQRFSRQLAQARGGTGELRQTLRQYNVQIVDSAGRTRGMIEVLRDLADAVKSSSDGSEDLRIAFRAFLSEGAELVNTLDLGSEGLDRYNRKARELGLVLSEEAIRKAELADERFGELSATLKAASATFLIEYTDGIIRLTEGFVALAKAIPKAADALARFLNPTDEERLETLRSQLARITRLIEQVERFGGNPIDLRIRFTEIQNEINRLTEATTPIQVLGEVKFDETQIKQEVQKATGLTIEQLKQAEALTKALRTPAEQYADSIAEAGRLLEVGAISQETFNRAVAQAKSRLDSVAVSQATVVQSQEAFRESVVETEKALQAELKVLERGARITEELRTPTEAYVASIRELQELFRSGAIDAEVFNRGIERSKATLESTRESSDGLTNSARELGFTFASAFEDAIVEGNSLRDVLKGLAQDIARLTVRKAVTEPIAAALAGAISGGFGGGAGGGGSRVSALQAGGTLRPGQVGLVGEKGPELISTRIPARITPNKDIGSLGGTNSIMTNFNFEGVNQATVLQLKQEGQLIAEQSAALVIQKMRRENL